MKRLFFLLTFLFLLVSCGGGGGSDSPEISTNVQKSVTVNALRTTEHIEVIPVSFGGVVRRSLQATPETFNPSIIDARFESTSDTTGNLIIKFASALSVGEGTYNNKILLFTCNTARCTRGYIVRSEINTTLIAAPVEVGSVLIQESVSARGSAFDRNIPATQRIPVILSNSEVDNISALHIGINKTIGIQNDSFVEAEASSSDQINLEINFGDPGFLSLGKNESSYEVDICVDKDCVFPLEGSPLTLNVEYDVTDLPINVNPLKFKNRTKLDHNVIDSEFSSKLNAIVIASSLPKNSIYVYNLNNIANVEAIELDYLPFSVSVSNAGDSNNISVGHRNRVTYINYDTNDPQASLKKLLDVPSDVVDLIANDTYIYTATGFIDPYKISIETNVQSSIDELILGLGRYSKIKMHPSLNYSYITNSEGFFQNNITRLDIGETTDIYKYSPYDDRDYDICGNLWLSIQGDRIYTACGNVFKSSELASEDMTYIDKMNLFENPDDNSLFKIRSFAESSLNTEIAVIQTESERNCILNSADCLTILSFYNKDTFSLTSHYSNKSVLIDDSFYNENAKFVFYDENGNDVFLVTELEDSSIPISYISEIAR